MRWWRAARLLLPALPAALCIADLFLRDELSGAGAILAAAALLVTTLALSWLANASLARAAHEAARGFGPDSPADPEWPADPAARAVWPAIARLDRAWRDHASATQRRLAAAEAVIAALPDPLFAIDARRRIVRANAAAAALVGRDAESRDLAAALRNPALLAAVDAVLRGEPERDVEFALSLPVERMMRAHIASLALPADENARVILRLYDVSELRRSEQMRADFIANAGHELKTPLTALIGFIETLLGPARNDAAARDRFLGIMRMQAQRMARLVGDLLSLSRIELNEHVAPDGRVALPAVISEVARGLELRAAERSTRIVIELPPELPDIRGDEDELAQIFQNLLDNAIKYSRPNSDIRVTGGVEHRPTGTLVQIAVTDQGEGIAAHHLPRLTERFYRVDTARSRELGGTGLGLAIVKHIVNRHRGRLDITSRPGEGSTFRVWLPAAHAVAPVIEP